MASIKKLAGQHCYLAPIDETTAALWTSWDNDLAVTIPLGDEAYTPMTLPRSEEIVRAAMRDQAHVFTIVSCQNDEPIGRCMLFNIDLVNRNAMLGIVIGEKSYWGKGYGQEALRLLLDYGFNLLNLHSIMLGVFAFNQRAIAAYRRVGFKEIGRRRETRMIAGKWYDAILMDMLDSEFEGGEVRAIMAEYA